MKLRFILQTTCIFNCCISTRIIVMFKSMVNNRWLGMAGSVCVMLVGAETLLCNVSYGLSTYREQDSIFKRVFTGICNVYPGGLMIVSGYKTLHQLIVNCPKRVPLGLPSIFMHAMGIQSLYMLYSLKSEFREISNTLDEIDR